MGKAELRDRDASLNSPNTEASKLLEAALQQMDGIISGEDRVVSRLWDDFLEKKLFLEATLASHLCKEERGAKCSLKVGDPVDASRGKLVGLVTSGAKKEIISLYNICNLKLVSSICTPILIQGRVERTETNLIAF